MDDMWIVVETRLRVPHGLPIATILDDYHMGPAYTAWDRLRCLVVMTTTRVKTLQELR